MEYIRMSNVVKLETTILGMLRKRQLPREEHNALLETFRTLNEYWRIEKQPPVSYLAYVERMLNAAQLATIASESEAAQ